MPRNKC